MGRPTAIWNQDSVLELLTRELARTAREGGEVCVMLAAIDPPATASDALLGEIAQRFSLLLRPYDHVGRYGADQLLVVVPGSNVEGVLVLAEKLRQSVAQSPVEVSGGRQQVSVSIAVADGARRSAEELLNEVSSLRHRAQALGGNRVESARKLPAAPSRALPKRRMRLSLWIGGALLGVLAILALVAPATLCAPLLLGDVFNSNELPPPLPADCVLTNEHPSDATLHTLESQRATRGLILEGTVTCKISSSGPKDRSVQIDQAWLDTIYINGTMQYKRHVLLAAHENVKGGTLFTVEQCLMPWWTYVTQPQDRCWEEYEFSK
jgi:diguanylate cyclase (GGDEF)-like protein